MHPTSELVLALHDTDVLTAPTKNMANYSVVPDNVQAFAELKARGVRGFLIAGLYSEICIMHSVFDLLELGFNMIVITDLIASFHPPQSRKYEHIERMKKGGAKAMNSTEAISILNY